MAYGADKELFAGVVEHGYLPKGELTTGRTVVDVWGVTRSEPNADVALDIDRDAFIALLYEALRSYAPGAANDPSRRSR